MRVRFPDGYILEADFHPSETVQSLMDFLKKVISRPDLPFYLCKSTCLGVTDVLASTVGFHLLFAPLITHLCLSYQQRSRLTVSVISSVSVYS